MLNKLRAFIREQNLLQRGDHVICAVSGGADSMALLWGMYLLREEMGFALSAAHFNHGLRGEESDGDSRFVEQFCRDYGVNCYLGSGKIQTGKKGLEAAARDARYAFLESLPGTVATAHTADDNAETLLMHLVRGTGLKGLGGIAPIRGKLIRPMLCITRQEVEQFLAEYSIPYVTDSSNETDAFLRNRLRHHIMPLLKQENPSLAENLSKAALRLRQDEAALEQLAREKQSREVARLRTLDCAVRSRVLADLLKEWGVKEPEAEHIDLLQSLVDSSNPSACAHFPGNITVTREYGVLKKMEERPPLETRRLQNPGVTEVPELGLIITCTPVSQTVPEGLLLRTDGELVIRSRLPGDTIRLPGGTKSLKKLFIDRKIPASQRSRIPVLADAAGVAAVIGVDHDRGRLEDPTVCIRWEYPASKEK